MRALVVEHCPNKRATLGEALATRGHSVTLCADVKAAWTAWQAEPFALVLLDIDLPGEDGSTLCQRLRADGANTTIIIATGSADAAGFESILSVGADDYLSAPFTSQDLALRLAIAERRSVDRTASVQTEEALRDSEERFLRREQEADLLDKVRSALAQELDLSLLFNTVVEAIASAFGYTQVSLYLVEGDALMLQHQVGYDRVLARISLTDGVAGRVVRTGEPVFLADVSQDPSFLGAIDGVVSEVCVPLCNTGGVVGILNVESTAGVALTTQDLALVIAVAEHVDVAIGRARLHDAVRSSERRYRTLVEQIPVVTYIERVEGEVERLLYVSPQVETVLGMGQDDFAAAYADWAALIHPDDRDRVLAADRTATESRQPFRAEYRHLTSEGSYVWLRDEAVMLPSGVGEPQDWQGVMVDVTALKDAEAALRASEERFRAIVETTAEWIWEIDRERRLTYSNPAVVAILGYAPEDLYGTDCRDLIHEADRTDARRFLAERFAAGDGWSGVVFPWRHVDGGHRWLESNGVPVRDGDGAIVGFRGADRDVTARKALEEQLVYQATHDTLTGLPNRALFRERLEQSLARPGHRPRGTSILYIDLDGFKEVNDTLGHDAGDRLLIAVASRLRTSVRVGDTVARLGGDEFAVLMEDLGDDTEASAAADRLSRRLRAPIRLGGRNVVIKASIGIALADSDADRPEELLRLGDAAMYAAKRGGTGRSISLPRNAGATVAHD